MKATLSIEVESIEELLRLVTKLGDTEQKVRANVAMDGASLRVAQDRSRLPTRLREVCDVLTEQEFHSRVNIIVRAFDNGGYISREEADTLYGKQDYRGFTMPINKACKAKGWDKCLEPEYGPGEGYRPALGFTIPAEYLAPDALTSG